MYNYCHQLAGTPNTSHNIVDNNPPPTQAGTSHGHLAATHPGSREVNNIMKSDQLTPRGLWEGNGKLNDSRSASTTQGGDVLIVEQDVVYDQPIVLHKKQPPDGAENDDNDVDLEGVDLRTLFDDPGYTKGMMKQSQSHALSAQEYTPQTDLQAANSLTHNIQMHSNKVWEDGAEPEMKTLSVQMGRVPVMKSSINSLSLLDYDDSELDELDPVIASCLRTPYLSDTDDEIAISEV